MTEQITQVSRVRRRPGPDIWSAGALLIAAMVLAPILAVFWIALTPTDNIWPHLVSTTLPRYLINTGFLMVVTGSLAAVAGTAAAWMITQYRFPLSRVLEWALLLPLSVPAYVGAYALVEFLEYAGPLQTMLRDLFGWQNAQDYRFPEIRSRGFASIVLAAALYPYVYLLARAAFREGSADTFDVARALGAGPFARFFKIGLPLARPAIAAGTAIVLMETVSDFGTVEFFAVQTLTTGIFSVWLEGYNAGGAAQIASLVLILVLMLVGFEKAGRARLRFFRLSRQSRPIVKTALTGPRGWLACALCAVPFLVGFVLPATVIASHAAHNIEGWADPGLMRALLNSAAVGGTAAFVTVLGALFMVYGVRQTGRRLPRLLLPFTTIGYAAPGAVIGIGILIPLSFLDHGLADAITFMTGTDPGLLLTGSAFAIVLAYVVRFFAIAQGAVDSAMGRVAPSLPLAARSLGRGVGGVLREIYVPLIKGSVGTALLLVFVDCLKELPATLLLRPFNFDTLATRVYDQASLENITDAAPPALMVMAVSLVAVLWLARTNR
ncbi:iron ABC transporter permease [uncultured Litoreibacter sp.]|uniref:ABC transporter permease n=1 Tax=uncultured Litoreibacter sp. TaxID=1392394 RepID=UPI002623EFEF|nr:iron ABC transporter permease [uncultured Litoreibacter sp.]